MPDYLVPLRRERRPRWATVDFDIFPVTDTERLTSLLSLVAEHGAPGHLAPQTVTDRVTAVADILDREYGHRYDGAQVSIAGCPRNEVQTVLDVEFNLGSAAVLGISVFDAGHDPITLYHAWLGRDLEAADDEERFARAKAAVDALNASIID